MYHHRVQPDLKHALVEAFGVPFQRRFSGLAGKTEDGGRSPQGLGGPPGDVAMKGNAFYTENQFLDAMLLHVRVHHESRIEKYRAAVVKRRDLDLPMGLRWTHDSGFERRIQGLLAKAKEAFIKKRSDDRQRLASHVDSAFC